MRAWLNLGLAIFLLGLPSVVASQEIYVSEEQQKQLHESVKSSSDPEVQSVINLYSNVLSYSYPKEFVPVYQAKSQEMFMLEFIPYGEDVKENWTEMLTIQAFRGERLNSTTASDFAIRLAKKVGENCPETKIFEDLGSIEVDGATSHRVVFGCTDRSVISANQAGEIAIAQTIKRNDSLILVQFASRGKSSTDSPRFSRKYYETLLDRLLVTNNPLLK
ncbi:hypothetical protein EUU23_07455 [Sphingorhabdus sp. IMCC26285]|uniref:Uncharacterized protein n=1 Tax=Sphingorhabdus profundilacus TaxID=2509718 RepID=A0A6I4M023_9SPHN|nr:hypothetical protein [Sphingorhabdus profundilacus]MVZ97540.1 hypothetical protein [Sphingorhabdus profundilacus]